MEDSLPQQKTQFVPKAHEGLTCAKALLFNRAGIEEAGESDQL